QLRKRGNAATVALDGDDRCAGFEQCAGEAAGAGPHFVDSLAGQCAGNRGDAGEELTVENEVLAERLARAQPVAGNDLPERLAPRRHAARRRSGSTEPAA